MVAFICNLCYHNMCDDDDDDDDNDDDDDDDDDDILNLSWSR